MLWDSVNRGTSAVKERMQACIIGLSIDEDIKLRSRRRSWKGHIYIHAPRGKRTPLTRPYPGYAHQCRNKYKINIGDKKPPFRLLYNLLENKLAVLY